MTTQSIDVAYSQLSGIQFFDDQGKRFDGNLLCPSAGITFHFNQKAGSSGWQFNAMAVDHVSGPDEAELSWTVQAERIVLTDPGNGLLAESNYDYTLTIETTEKPIETVSVDPRIRNTGGN